MRTAKKPSRAGIMDTMARRHSVISIMASEPIIIVTAVIRLEMLLADWLRMVSVSLVILLITSPVFSLSRNPSGIRVIFELRSFLM